MFKFESKITVYTYSSAHMLVVHLEKFQEQLIGLIETAAKNHAAKDIVQLTDDLDSLMTDIASLNEQLADYRDENKDQFKE